MNALIIGRDHGLAWALPQLLTRAGFSVDAIISSPLMKRCKFLRNCFLVPHTRSLIPTIAEKMNKGYDWIVITEDGPLTEVLESNLSVEDKLKILPVQAPENFIHLYSKIGLSKVFSDQGVPTPPSAVAKTITEALSEANRLGYPILLKQDSSGGGSGIFEAHSAADLKTLQPQFFQKPVLVQKQIPGIEVDLSPLYFHGKLIHFNYAKIEKTTSRFGPSSVRTYSPLSRVDEQVFRELAHIGKVLGAHGFVNMSCIESEGRRFYFEADMRPNAWVEFPRFFSEDPAIRIRNWFLNKETLSYPVPASVNQPSHILLPYFLRLKYSELLCNRYRVWKCIPTDDPKLLVRLLFPLRIWHHLMRIVKWVIPDKYHDRLRKLKSIRFNPHHN